MTVSNHHRQIQVPFVIYARFEPITEKVQGCTPDNIKSCTNKFQKHTGCSYGCKVVCCYDDKYTNSVKIYRGGEPVKKIM